MNHFYIPYASVLIISAVLIVAVAALCLTRRGESRAVIPLALLLLSAALWSTAEALGNLQGTLPGVLFWVRLKYVGVISVAPLWFLFSVYYSQREQWLSRTRVGILWVIPLLTLLLVMTNERHGLIWSGLIEVTEPAFHLVREYGPGFWLMAGYGHLLACLGVLLVLWSLVRSGEAFRRQGLLVMLAALAPVLTNMHYLAGGTLMAGIDPTPLGFLVGGVLLYRSLTRYRLFDLLPVARSTLIEKMREGVLVLDHQQRLVDINPAARVLLDLPTIKIGEVLLSAAEDSPHLLEMLAHAGDSEGELIVERPPARVISVQFARLNDQAGSRRGQLITLRDVTHTRRLEQELRDANERLQAQLAEIEALHEEVREQAIRDPLTGLFNRRYFEESLERELARAHRAKSSLVLAMLDLDDFKVFNDTFGHQGGDEVLQALGAFLHANTRESDICCRFGGEEFVVVLPDTHLSDARHRAEAWGRLFYERGVSLGAERVFPSLSIGLAAFPEHGTTADDLLASADRALYAAKAAGRNRVMQAVTFPEGASHRARRVRREIA